MLKKNQKYEEKLTELREKINYQDERIKQNELQTEKLVAQNSDLKEYKLRAIELIKENEFINSKLRFLESNNEMKMGGSIGIPRSNPQMSLGNFGMEDEAGEEFNNTYLAHLKGGQGSQTSLDFYSASELQKRNSMYPQHMRGSYAVVGMDRNLGEQEMKVMTVKFLKLRANQKIFRL